MPKHYITLSAMVVASLSVSLASGKSLTPARLGPKFPWSWDKIMTFSYGTNTSCCGTPQETYSCCSGIDNPEEIKWKLRYDIDLIDNDLSAPACRNANGKVNWTLCNDFRAARAGDLKAVDPNKPVFVYRGGPFGCDPGMINGGEAGKPDDKWYDYLASPPVWRTLKETWLIDRFGVVNAGTCDFRQVAAQNFWLTQMVFGPTPKMRWLQDPRIDGMFSDSGLIMGWRGDKLNITIGTLREIFNGTATTMARMAKYLNKVDKHLTFSLKDHFSQIRRTGGGDSGGTLCDPQLDANEPVQGHDCFPYGEEVLFEIMGDVVWIPFREYNIPSRDFGKDNVTSQPDGCAAAIIDHALEAHRMPTMACNNDGSKNTTVLPGQFGNLTWLEQHEISLAAFLMGAEEGSYFGSGMHWDDPGWHVWWTEYDKPLGTPHGAFTRDGYVFSREFEHLSVTADCVSLQATFDWH